MTQIPQHFPFPIPRKAFKAQFGGGFAVRGEEFGEHGAFKLLCFGKAGALLGEGFVQPSEKIAEGGLFFSFGRINNLVVYIIAVKSWYARTRCKTR